MKLFHGTLRENLPEILRDGISVGEGWGGAGTSGVFLSRTREGALYWAKLAWQRANEEKLEVERFDRRFPNPYEVLAVVEVEIPPDCLVSLKADLEQEEDMNLDQPLDPDDWQASLDLIGDVRFDGPVRPEWLSHE
jgi:hypothetical protein